MSRVVKVGCLKPLCAALGTTAAQNKEVSEPRSGPPLFGLWLGMLFSHAQASALPPSCPRISM